MNNFIKEIKSADRDVHKYFLSTAIIGFNFFGLVAVVFNLYLLRLGYDIKFIGTANACAPLSFALTGVIAGILGKKYGNRPISVLAVLLLIISNILIPLSQQLPSAYRETAIISLRIMTGAGFSLFMVNVMPYLAAATTDEQRVLVFSIQSAVAPAAGILGSLSAGFVPAALAQQLNLSSSSPLPFAYLIISAGILIIPTIPILLSTSERLKTTATDKNRNRSTSSREFIFIVLTICCCAFFSSFGTEITNSFFNVYLKLIQNKSPRVIGLLMATGQLTTIPAVFLSTILAKKVGKISGFALSSLISGAGLVLIILTPNLLITAIGYAISVCARTVSWTLRSVVQMRQYHRTNVA